MLSGPIRFHSATLHHKAIPGKRFFEAPPLYHFTGTVIFFPKRL
jgi:hypothetical protein